MSASNTPSTPTPQDPFTLAHQISSDPAIPDEQKLSWLAEIGKGVGAGESVERLLALTRLPIGARIEQIGGAIARREHFAKVNSEFDQQMGGLLKAEREVVETRYNEIARGLAELRREHEPRIAEADKVVKRITGER